MHGNMELAKEMARMIQQFKKSKVHPENPECLRHSEFILLSSINHTPGSGERGVKASELSTQLEITPAAVTHMINSLEEGGYLERFSLPGDRRVVLVRLTEKGKNYCIAKEEKFLQKFQELVEYLGEGDSRELIRIMSKAFAYFRERRL